MYDITTLQKQNKKTRNIHKDMDCPIDIIHYLHTQTYIHEIYTYWVPLLKQNYKKNTKSKDFPEWKQYKINAKMIQKNIIILK